MRRINITGNNRTRDEVIRREMRQFEGGWYSTTKINRSKLRVDRLNYFNAVNLETPAVPGSTDQIDVNVEVKEKPTGAVMFGAGYSNMEGLILERLYCSGQHIRHREIRQSHGQHWKGQQDLLACRIPTLILPRTESLPASIFTSGYLNTISSSL